METITDKMVKVDSGGHNYYLDGYLKSNLDHVIEDVTQRNFDCFIIVAGREGYGKSTLAMQTALYCDPTFNLDRIVFTSEQFLEAVENAEKYQAIVFDETMGYLSSRGAMSSFNKILVKVMSEMRSKNLFVFLCIPSYFELDKYPAIHRSTGLLYAYKRSFFASYDYRKKKELYLIGKKTYSYITKPSFRGRFVKYFPISKTRYENKKQKAIAEFVGAKQKELKLQKQRDSLIKDCFSNNYYTIKQLSDLIGLSLKQLYNITGMKGERTP